MRKEALHVLNLRSRDNTRTPFRGMGSGYGGFSETKPWLDMAQEYPTCNAQAESACEDSVLAFYKKDDRVSPARPVPRCMDLGHHYPVPASPDVIAYCRTYQKKRVWCWFNFGHTEAEETVPDGLEPVWGDLDAVTVCHHVVRIPPHRFVLMYEKLL